MDATMISQGQKLLLAVPGTEAELAMRLGCGAAVVGHWRRGRRTPAAAHRRKLELIFGIPPRAWDVPPGAGIQLEQRDHATSPEDAGTLEITKAQISEILEALKEEALIESEAAKLRDTAAKLLALRARLERDRDMLEDRIVRGHPEWLKLRTAILAALKPHPAALAAVLEAIK